MKFFVFLIASILAGPLFAQSALYPYKINGEYQAAPADYPASNPLHDDTDADVALRNPLLVGTRQWLTHTTAWDKHEPETEITGGTSGATYVVGYQVGTSYYTEPYAPFNIGWWSVAWAGWYKQTVTLTGSTQNFDMDDLLGCVPDASYTPGTDYELVYFVGVNFSEYVVRLATQRKTELVKPNTLDEDTWYWQCYNPKIQDGLRSYVDVSGRPDPPEGPPMGG